MPAALRRFVIRSITGALGWWQRLFSGGLAGEPLLRVSHIPACAGMTAGSYIAELEMLPRQQGYRIWIFALAVLPI